MTTPTRPEILAKGRRAAAASSKARSASAKQRVTRTLNQMSDSDQIMSNRTLQDMAGVHQNWLYVHREFKARADEIRARIRDDKLQQALSHRTEIELIVQEENQQLLSLNHQLTDQLNITRTALARCRANDGESLLTDQETIKKMTTTIDHLNQQTHKLTIERDTAVAERNSVSRDITAARREIQRLATLLGAPNVVT